MEFIANLLYLGSKGSKQNVNLNRQEILKKAYPGIEDEFKKYFSYCPKQKIITYNTDGASVRYANPNWLCDGITVKDNRRVTVAQRSSFKRTVHVFGGSTIFGSGSSDKYTIPSLLQKKLNNIDLQIRVINYGFPSFVAIQQFQKLNKTEIKEGDIVIFYDGGNDIIQREFYNSPEGTIIGYNKANKIGFFFSSLRIYLSEYSKLYYYLGKLKRYSQNKEVSQNVSKCDNDEFNKKEFEKKKWLSYYQTLIDAKNFTESKNASFYHFLQPTLNFDLLEESDLDYLKGLDNDPNYDLCFLKNISSKYQALNNSYLNYSSKFNGTSLSNVLINSSLNKNPGYYFIDYIHISPYGNEIVSEAIFKKIFKF